MPLIPGAKVTARVTAYGSTAVALTEDADKQVKAIFGEDWNCEMQPDMILVTTRTIGGAVVQLSQDFIIRATYRP